MSYYVIKTVKGHQYLYLQTSYREGGKVKTKSEYIGALNPMRGSRAGKAAVAGAAALTKAEVAIASAPKESDPAGAKVTTSDALPSPTAETPVITTPARTRKAQPKRKLAIRDDAFRDRVNLQKFSISAKSLQSKQNGLAKRLAAKGLDVRAMPSVTIKKGLSLKQKRKRKTGDMIVTLPHGKKNKAKFRNEVFRAFGHCAITAMQQQQPDRYLQLSLRFDESFRSSQNAIARYVQCSRDRRALYKVIALKVWGNAAQLTKNLPDPGKVGLVDLSQRKTWQEEAVGIYAAIEQRGRDRFIAEHAAQFAKARNELGAADKTLSKTWPLTLKRARAKRRLQRATVRFDAQKEMSKKIQLVDQMFF